MTTSVARSVALAAALASAGLLAACWDSDGLGALFGAPNEGGDGGFDPGVGGGLQLRDLFVNARLLRDPPKIVRTAPANNAEDVSVKTAIVVEFSESMHEAAVRTGLSLFQSGSSTSTATVSTFFQGDSVVVMVPQSDLLPNTQYEIVVAGPVSDLQGDVIERTNGAADTRFRFRTIQGNSDPDFDVIFSTPNQQASEVPRGSEAVLVFSEPIDVTSTATGLNGPGNLVVRRGGTTLLLNSDYTVATFPSANPRGAQIAFTSIAAAGTEVEITIDDDVRSADGQESVEGGNGFDLTCTVQDTAVPEDVTFPSSPLIPGSDGAISSVTLHAFPADVDLTADGNLPDKATIVYFDAGTQNALLFTKDATEPTQFISDLQPQTTPALQDGDVVVGVYVERRGFRSEVTLLKDLVMDTVGPRLVEMGDPNLNPSTLITQVNDPVLHGRMSEPCAGVQVDFDGAGAPDFNSIEFVAGQSTIRQELFVTSTTEDAALPAQLEPKAAFSVITSDVFGNLSVNADTILHLTVGMVGAAIGSPDATSALYVAGFAGDLFQPFPTGAVLIDDFPPSAVGTGQIARGLSSSGGVARFTEAELHGVAASDGNDDGLITVTVLAKRSTGATNALFGPITFAGVQIATAASPRAILALMTPEGTPSVKLKNDVQCDILGENPNNPIETGSAFVDDVVPATEEQEKLRTLVPSPSLADNVFDLPLNQLQCFVVNEQFVFGGVQQRFSSSEPFLALDDPGQIGFSKVRAVDFTGQSGSYSDTSHPQLVHTVTFDDVAVSTGGSVGLNGTEGAANQLRELRLVSRLPGFVGSVGIAATSTFVPNVNNRTGTVVLPLPLVTNDSVAGTGIQDSPFERILQPDLLDDNVAVDTTRIRRNLRIELIVGEKGIPLASAASTRERFLLDPTAADAQVAAPQSIPVVTLTDSNHPPQIDWTEATQGEGMHCLSLISNALQQWRIYVPASAAASIVMRVPSLPAVLPDGVGTTDFSFPGTFRCFVESFDFDPTHVFTAGSTEQYHFDPQRWWQSDLEREFLKASRSDPLRTISTN